MINWLNTKATDEDVVVSSRIRLARNLNNHKFPLKATIEESNEITEKILDSLKDSIGDNYSFNRLNDIDENSRMRYVENHLISPKLSMNVESGSFLVRDDDRVSIMINEEDHIRMQVLSRGLNFKENWDIVNEVDDYLDKEVEYAFDKKWGYLTACPTNVGTGLRVSVMLHLPCLSKTGNMPNLVDGLKKIGIATRGVYGEGSNELGNMYQISNQKTLGETEEETIKRMDNIVKQIISRERQVRQYLYENKALDLEDKIFRSIGVLKYARKLEVKETMDLLSIVRLGYELNVLKEDYLGLLDLMMNIQTNNIQHLIENQYKYDDIGEQEVRALIVNEYVTKLEG